MAVCTTEVKDMAAAVAAEAEIAIAVTMATVMPKFLLGLNKVIAEGV